MKLTMSQQSHISEGGFSDIISDVETFVKENDLGGVVDMIKEIGDEPLVKPFSYEGKRVIAEEPDEDVLRETSVTPDFPPCVPRELCTTDYPGSLNFNVFVGHNVAKTSWEYSTSLNKVYIDIKQKFPIHFSVNRSKISNLFVRVMPVFLEDHFIQELVYRCICHEQIDDPSNESIAEHIIPHIIRCDNRNARYFGDKNTGKRLSLVIPLSTPQPGTDTVKELFMFMCKNSCPGGMNRKPIQIVFTLEDTYGFVLGRRILNVRICSCPKRDREKEEEKITNGLRSNRKVPISPIKKRNNKRKSDNIQQHSISDKRILPFNINIVGVENFKTLATLCHNLMAAEILKLEGKKEDDAPYRKCISDIKDLISSLPQE